jgi:hypothetical protein
MSDSTPLPHPRKIMPTGGWKWHTEQAKDIYWKARRDGATENEALVRALDAALGE